MDRGDSIVVSRYDFIKLLSLSILSLLTTTEQFGTSIPIVLWIAAMCLAYKNPIISIYFLVITQLVPPVSGINLTQLYIVVWFLLNFRFVSSLKRDRAVLPIFIFLFVVLFRDFIFLDFEDMMEYVKLLLYVVVAYFEISKLKSIKESVIPIIFATLVGVIGYYCFLLFNFTFITNSDHLAGEAIRGGVSRFMVGNGDYNFYAAYVLVGYALTLGLFLFERNMKRRFNYFLLLFLYIFAILASMSRGALIALIMVSFIFLFILYSRKGDTRIKYLLIFFLFLGLFFFIDYFEYFLSAFLQTDSESSIEEDVRFLLWERYFDLFLEYPFWGAHGIAQFPSLAAHNTFVELLANYGILIWIFFISLCANPFIRLFKKFKNNNSSKFVFYFPFISLCISFMSLSILGFKVFWLILLILYKNENSMAFNNNRLSSH